MDARTTGRFGSHTIPELMLGHRCSGNRVVPTVLWVSAPVPLSVEEVASLLYATREQGEVSSVADTRRMICDIVVNGGALTVADMLYEAGQDRARSGREAVEHWEECLRLARAAIAPHDATGPSRSPLRVGGRVGE